MQPPSSPPPGIPPPADTPADASPQVTESVAPVPESPPAGPPATVFSEIETSHATDSGLDASGDAGPPQGTATHDAEVLPGVPPGTVTTTVTTNAEIPLSPAPPASVVQHGPENASVYIPPFVANGADAAPADASPLAEDDTSGYAPAHTPGEPSSYAPFAPPSEYGANIGEMPPAYPPSDSSPGTPPFAPAFAPAIASENAPVVAPPGRTASRRLRMAGVAAATLGACILSAALLGGLAFAAVRLADTEFSYGFLTLEGLRFWVPGLLLAALAGVLVWFVAGRNAAAMGLPSLTAGVFPFATMLAGLLFLSVYHTPPWLVAAPVIAGVVLIVGTVSRLLLRDPSGTAHDIARTVLTISTYVVAFVTLAMVYINKLRSVQSATAVTLLCALLLLQMTDGEEVPLARRLVYALAGGLIVGQVTWVINYWSATGWTGGAFLLAVFYLVAGLSAAQLRGRIGRFDVAEFGIVSALALLIVSAAVLIQS